MKTDRLYYTDSYLRDFRANIIQTSDDAHVAYLDRTAFYPASGGQPFDTGAIGGISVEEVVDEGELIAHRLASPLHAREVECAVDWKRRFDHMQQHTGQHLLSAVIADLFGWQTLSFHMGAEASTIELATSAIDSAQMRAAEQRAAELIAENRIVTVSTEDAATVQGLRKETERSGPIRIVSIEELDRSACGGTHVRSTGEIGCILLRATEKIRGNIRLEFVCGGRAVARARADYDALTTIGRSLSAAIDNTPSLVQALIDRVGDLDKARRKLSAELAAARGRTLYDETNPNAAGFRIVRKQVALNDEARAEAQAFTARPKALYVAWQETPPSVLLACSADSGKHAGNLVKDVIAARGGKGGGSALIAQASIPAGIPLPEILDAISAQLE